ncbi:DUF2514 domain-containing protein [Cupriavidus gilardii]|uniref:DUF2514 domain-containing protein n=1 Tax=Cupriavidus gilardii TaxID=82541 RepID=UPI0021B4210C|nr:DUF2514 domain-containing protein [Cupriavidus gilardii]UXC37208.1 DUF2514 domain-containing protein [Cupriavidus gilardii]
MPWVKIIAAVAALALAFLAGSEFTARGKDAEIAEIRRAAAVDQVKAADRARAEEQRRIAAQSEIANAAKQEADKARADARAADAVAGQLRQRVAELVAAGRPARNPAATSGSETADDPLGVLADVLIRADRRAGILAEYADAARIAGQACERAYDALSRSDALHR